MAGERGFDKAYPIIVWNNTIVDGHHRYQICQELGIEPIIVEKEFESLDHVLVYAYEAQLGRRNLNETQRATIAYKLYYLEESIAARKRQATLNKSQEVLGVHGTQAEKTLSLHQVSQPSARILSHIPERDGAGNLLDGKPLDYYEIKEDKPPEDSEKKGRARETIAKKAGVGATRRIHPHLLRHSFAMWSLESNVPIYDLQKQLGHASLDATGIYLEASPNHRREAYMRSKMASLLIEDSED